MNVAAISSAAPGYAALIQSILQEATETPTQTRLEALSGDMQAIRKLQLISEFSALQSSPAPASAPSTEGPGALLNARA